LTAPGEDLRRQLPATIDGAKVAARYENGVLTVTLPKREEARPRTIRVSAK
jgi:HSP20 family protein